MSRSRETIDVLRGLGLAFPSFSWLRDFLLKAPTREEEQACRVEMHEGVLCGYDNYHLAAFGLIPNEGCFVHPKASHRLLFTSHASSGA